ncbi:VanZ family protein [Metabacillus sp. KIGAM252]|uniref:VanZ family protein n=1 Tax=Metabacillus flavus TaxID=2823519 RepID=A0ABS5LDE9_9BACI|nr:VanZ family protein [Metabacillus flavus]MBS2968726.1 VanZ family protein [Metabacillus flavus]
MKDGMMIMVKKQLKTVAAGTLIIYLAFLLKLVLFKHVTLYESPEHFAALSGDLIKQNFAYSNMMPFATVKRYMLVAHSRPGLSIPNLLGNLAGFIPFGLLMPVMVKKLRNIWFMLLLSFLFSLALEIIQLSLALGVFDVDDLLLNTAGGVFGYLLFSLLIKTGRSR